MLELIKEFPEQLLKALELGEKASIKHKFNGAIKNIVVCGLGGSGIGGDLMAELYRDELKIPVIVNKGYSIPAFVDANTLLILCSYSGNTEETTTCAKFALQHGLHAVCITSGGKLAEIANQNNFDLITLPTGFPPRAALGYSAVQLFYVLLHYGLITDAFKAEVKNTAALLTKMQAGFMDDTKALAQKIAGKIIIAYAEDKYQSVALRLKQQINENGKMHCWYSALPELNHNELVGWRETNNNIALIVFRTADEYPRIGHRSVFTQQVAKTKTEFITEFMGQGKTPFEKHFYMIHWGDWLSYYLSVAGGYEAEEIDVLIKLKTHMNAIPE